MISQPYSKQLFLELFIIVLVILAAYNLGKINGANSQARAFCELLSNITLTHEDCVKNRPDPK